jgi:Trk-type K+ transport system membrane component
MLILLMFIGQLGVSSTILVWGNKKSRSSHYSYIKEDITIG